MANEVSLVGDKVLAKTEKRWLEDMSQKCVPVDDGKMMCEKAQVCTRNYCEEVEKMDFKASEEGWLAVCIVLQPQELKDPGEPTWPDVKAASRFPEAPGDSQKREKGFRPEQAPVVMIRLVLGWSPITPISMNASARRAPGLQVWKDHLTLVPCGNTAVHKSKWANNPQALKHQTENYLHLFWHNNKKAWVCILLLEWFHQRFIPKKEEALRRREGTAIHNLSCNWHFIGSQPPQSLLLLLRIRRWCFHLPALLCCRSPLIKASSSVHKGDMLTLTFRDIGTLDVKLTAASPDLWASQLQRSVNA